MLLLIIASINFRWKRNSTIIFNIFIVKVKKDFSEQNYQPQSCRNALYILWWVGSSIQYILQIKTDLQFINKQNLT